MTLPSNLNTHTAREQLAVHPTQLIHRVSNNLPLNTKSSHYVMLTLCKCNPHVVGVCRVMASNGGAEEGTTVPVEE